MIYKFKSKAAADLIMLEPIGRKILTIIGKDPGPQGIIEVADMAHAIEVLKSAVSEDEAHKHDIDENHIVHAHSHDDEHVHNHLPHAVTEVDAVTLKQRARPFIDMLEHALAGKKDIVWGV